MEIPDLTQRIPEQDKAVVFEIVTELQKNPFPKGSTVARKMDERKFTSEGWTIYYKVFGRRFHSVINIAKDTGRREPSVPGNAPGRK